MQIINQLQAEQNGGTARALRAGHIQSLHVI
jgi:hypothetical protein